MKNQLTPPAQWPIGCRYNTVSFVQSRDRDGIYDPICGERICLPDETGQVIDTLKRNPYCTIYDVTQRKWRGVVSNG